jgi:peroxin-6
MTGFNAMAAVQRKRKRRRREDKPAVSAKLVLDDHVKGDVGFLSEDLFVEFFPHLQHGKPMDRFRYS